MLHHRPVFLSRGSDITRLRSPKTAVTESDFGAFTPFQFWPLGYDFGSLYQKQSNNLRSCHEERCGGYDHVIACHNLSIVRSSVSLDMT